MTTPHTVSQGDLLLLQLTNNNVAQDNSLLYQNHIIFWKNIWHTRTNMETEKKPPSLKILSFFENK